MDSWHIAAEELERLQKSGYMLYIVDVRDPVKYNESHIDNAVSMYVQDEEEGNMTCGQEAILHTKKGEGCLLVIYCQHGNTGMKCVRKLRQHGIVAYNLYGGFDNYLAYIQTD